MYIIRNLQKRKDQLKYLYETRGKIKMYFSFLTLLTNTFYSFN